jgi:putative tricarboxylic transport membrane protein
VHEDRIEAVKLVEQAFVTSLIKSDGSILPFFSRPVAAVLAAMTIAALLWPVGVWTWTLLRRQPA